MKRTQLRQIIKEEISRVLKEAVTPEVKGKLSKSLMAYHNEGGTKEQVISMVNTVFGKKENSVNESMAVNTSTGEDITGHLIDYMEGKITREEFEKLTGLTNLSTPMPPHMTDPSNSRY
tara:strand:- start:1029 stop:1385 length:357 start_codon:yes stop_codon:yes gene_type:complete